MKIYTKTGDKGLTSMYGGGSVPKNNSFIEIIGGLDEINSSLGVVACLIKEIHQERLSAHLYLIQNLMFDLGSMISFMGAHQEKNSSIQCPISIDFDQATQVLENWIDGLDGQLPPLRQFILPGGCLVASHVHHVRSVCRRIERLFVGHSYLCSHCPLGLMWLNRLSDYFFVLARYLNHVLQEKEVTWNKTALDDFLKAEVS